MQRRAFLALALSVATGALLHGCGGSSSSENPAGRGAAEGFVFVAADGALRLFATAAAGRAAGLRAASGARAQIVGGGPSATAGADGAVRLTGIEPGLRTLRLTPSGSGTPLNVPLTVVPDATLPLGETPISRQGAVEALQALAASKGVTDLFTQADVLVSGTPLPAGVALAPALPAGEAPLTIARPSWLVYVDRIPGARFGHRTAVALVDAQSGAVEARDSLSWPSLNGASFYAESTVNATSPDAVHVATRRHASHAAPPVAALHAAIRARAATCRAADPDTSRTHVLMVQGFPRDDFGADMDNVDLLLGAAPFPQIGTLKKIKTFEGSDSAGQIFLREFAAVRDACKSGDTFVLYVTSHGVIEGNYPEPTEGFRGLAFTPPPTPSPTPAEVAATYRLALMTGGTFGVTMIEDRTEVKADLIEPGALDFSPCKACRIILWIDTCYSGNWIPLVRPLLEALPEPKRDILILTAADQQHTAWPVPSATYPITLGNETIALTRGGAFSQSLLVGAARNRSEAVETGADLLAGSFSFAVAATGAANAVEAVDLQNPSFFRRALDPDEVCGRGDQEVTVQ